MSDSVFTPAQEARIKEIVRELLPEIIQAVLRSIQKRLALRTGQDRIVEDLDGIMHQVSQRLE